MVNIQGEVLERGTNLHWGGLCSSVEVRGIEVRRRSEGEEDCLSVGSCLIRLLLLLQAVIKDFYGENPKESNSFARIISQHHVSRLEKLFTDGEVGVDSLLANMYRPI